MSDKLSDANKAWRLAMQQASSVCTPDVLAELPYYLMPKLSYLPQTARAAPDQVATALGYIYAALPVTRDLTKLLADCRVWAKDATITMEAMTVAAHWEWRQQAMNATLGFDRITYAHADSITGVTCEPAAGEYYWFLQNPQTGKTLAWWRKGNADAVSFASAAEALAYAADYYVDPRCVPVRVDKTGTRVVLQ